MLDVGGDWIARRPGLRPGGWAFQYANPIIPMSTTPPSSSWRWIAQKSGDKGSMRRDRARREWIWACKQEWRLGRIRCRQRTYHLNNIPFADHGALLDPPTADVTVRCVSIWRSSADGGTN